MQSKFRQGIGRRPTPEWFLGPKLLGYATKTWENHFLGNKKKKGDVCAPTFYNYINTRVEQ
jgi:hypothetical protein